jgi:hypothetical protein
MSAYPSTTAAPLTWELICVSSAAARQLTPAIRSPRDAAGVDGCDRMGEGGWSGLARTAAVTVVMAHPALLRELVERCETLRWRLASGGSAETARQLDDATYTLCVVTGARQLDTALYVARRQLADAMARQQPLHH